MIVRCALLATLLIPTIASAQSHCRGIAALTGADGGRLYDISIREGRGGGIALFSGRRPVALPEADHCSFDISDDGERGFTCYFQEGPILVDGRAGRATLPPELIFAEIVSNLRECLPAPLPVDEQRSPLYIGATDVFALRRMRHDLAVPGGVAAIDVTMVETTNNEIQQYVVLSVDFGPEED